MATTLRPALLAGFVLLCGSAQAQTSPTSPPRTMQMPQGSQSGVLPMPPPAAAPQPAVPTAQAPAATARPAAPEPTPGQLAAARDLIAATNVLGSLDELIPSFSEQIKKQNVTRPEIAKDLDAVLASLSPELQLQKQRLTDIVARTYSRWLTETDMRELVAFFRTPLGQRYNKVQPDLIEDVVNDVGAWTQEVSEYTMIRVRAEMSKRDHQLQ